MLNRKAFVILFIGVCVSALLISNVAGGQSDSEIKLPKFKSFKRTFSNDNDSIIQKMGSGSLRRSHSTKERKSKDVQESSLSSTSKKVHPKTHSKDHSKHPPRRSQIDTSMLSSTVSQSSGGSSRGGSSRFSDDSSWIDSMSSLKISDGSSYHSSRGSSRGSSRPPPPPGVIQNIRGRAAEAATQGWGLVRDGYGDLTKTITPQMIDERQAWKFPNEGRDTYNQIFAEANYYTEKNSKIKKLPVKNPYDFYKGTGYVEGSTGGQYIKNYEQRIGKTNPN